MNHKSKRAFIVDLNFLTAIAINRQMVNIAPLDWTGKLRLKLALKNPRLWPWLIILPAAILRVWHAGLSLPWYDEAFTTVIIRQPMDQMWAAILSDVHPPLFYLLLRAWSWIGGTGIGWLRLFSAACSILALIQFWDLLEELGLPRRAALIALGIMAIMPANRWYGQEARMYALLSLLVILQLRALLTRRWGMLGLVNILALYTHTYALFYTGALGIMGLMIALKRPRAIYRHGDGELSGTDLPAVLLAFGLPLLAWLPWAWVLASQMATISAAYWIPPVTVGSVLAAVQDILITGILANRLKPVGFLCLMLGLLLITIQGLRRRWFGWIWMACAPVLMAVSVSLLWRSVILSRAMIGIIPPLAALAGLTLAAINRPRAWWIAALLLWPLALSAFYQFGYSEAGMAKLSTPPYQMMALSEPLIHLEDTTLITRLVRPGDRLLDAGCSEQPGALASQTRDALGIQKIQLANLRAPFFMAASLSPLSSACHEALFNQFTAGARPVFINSFEMGIWGVWYVPLR